MRRPDPGSQPLHVAACGGIRPVAFVHAAKSGWRKKRRRSQPSECGTSVWWRFSGYRPARLRPCWRRRRTVCRATPTRALCRTTICRRSRRFALQPLVARHRSEHVMENIHGPQRPRRAKTSALVDVAAAQTRRDASRAKGRCAAGGPVAAWRSVIGAARCSMLWVESALAVRPIQTRMRRVIPETRRSSSLRTRSTSSWKRAHAASRRGTLRSDLLEREVGDARIFEEDVVRARHEDVLPVVRARARQAAQTGPHNIKRYNISYFIIIYLTV